MQGISLVFDANVGFQPTRAVACLLFSGGDLWVSIGEEQGKMDRWMRTSRRSTSIAEPPSLALRPNYNRLLSGCAAAVAAAPRSPKLPNPDGGFSGEARTAIRQGS